MAKMPYDVFPLRLPLEAEAFREGLQEKRLRLMRCDSCGEVRATHSLLCPVCHGRQFSWIDASGKGEVYSYVVFQKAFHENVKQCIPYVVAQIKLQEGPFYIANIVNCHPNMVYCKQKVKLVWEKIGSDAFIPTFIPAGRDDD